jgi:hypothetical protein
MRYRLISVKKIQDVLCIILSIVFFQSTAFAQNSTDANLIRLSLSEGSLSPSFDSTIYSYSTSVPYETGAVTVTSTVRQSNATIKVRLNNGSYVTVNTSNASAPLKLSLGSNTIYVKVTAQNGTSIKTYSILITRKTADIITVLSNNAHYSKESSPQGALRYQRGFYLIKPGEVKKSGLSSGYKINGIGFTLSTAQNITTKGAFKLYIQNSNDKASRVDTGWVTSTSSIDSLLIPNGLFPGEYDWKIRTKNVNNNYSDFSDTLTFNNDNLKSCQSPTRLMATNIDSTSAKLNWYAPPGSILKYFLEYKYEDTVITNWTRVLVSGTSHIATGLKSKKQYRWRLKTSCSLTDSSYFNESDFSTTSTAICTGVGYTISQSISATPKTTTRGTGVLFRWIRPDSAVTNYNVRFRRVGTKNWLQSQCSNDSLSIDSGLISGTNYEWQVRANFGLGLGNYSILDTFLTPGLIKSYAPINLSVNKLTDSSAVLKWDGDGLTGNVYEVSFRLNKTISWQHAITGMTNVYNDSITIPNTVGQYNIPFKNNSPYNYNGGGIYVAWEYNQSSAALLSTPNFSLCTNDSTSFKDIKGIDSGATILGFISKNNFNGGGLKLQDILTSNDYRPETRFSSADLKDSVEVLQVYTLGNAIPKFQSPIPVSALVTNKSSKSKQYTVTLKVKQQTSGTLKYTETSSITVAAGDTAVVSFNGWRPKSFETDSIIVSIPQDGSENILNNNAKAYVQNLNATTISYADDNLSAFAVGSKTSSGGLLLNRHHLYDSAKVIAAQIYLTDAAIGHSFYAVVCDANKNIVAKSPSFTAKQKDINQYVPFYFPTPVSFDNADFYIGLAQSASSNKYLPLGTQWEGTKPRSNAYYMANLNGSGFVDSPNLGRLMIKAQVVSSRQDCFIDGKTKLCSGGNITLTAGKALKRYADSVVRYSSQLDNENNNNNSANQILGTPDVYPNTKFAPGVWASKTSDSSNEFIELRFPDADSINFVDIYEIQNAGAVDSVFTKNPLTSRYDLVWFARSISTLSDVARKNHIKLDSMISYPVSQIKITLRSDTSKGGIAGYNTIDAVAIGREKIPGNFNTYSWMPGGATSSNINVNNPGTYVLTTTDANGHESKDSVDVSVATLVIPKIFILDTLRYPIPNDTFCYGDSIRLVSDQVRGNLWSTQETSKYITVKSSASIRLAYTDDNGCNNTSTPFVVKVNALPVPTIDATNGGRICPGKSVTLTLTAPSSCKDYRWSTGATQNSTAVVSPGNYTVKVKDTITGCSGTSAPINLRVVSNPQPVISGALRFCPNDSTVLNVGSFSSYLWSTGSTSSTGVIKNAGAVNVTVTNSDGCKASANTSVSLFSKPMPTIIGKVKICPGETISISEGNGNFRSYLWTPGNLTTPTISINDSGTYKVAVTDQNGCVNSVTKLIPYSDVPKPLITGTNSTFQFCPGTSITLDAGNGFESYLWSNGQRSSSIVVDRVSSFSVIVTNALGCIGKDTAITSFNGAIPIAPGLITGQTIATCNNSNYSYSIAPINNTSYYTWIVPSGATIVSGQGSIAVVVKYGPLFKGGDIEVAASNTCGQSPSIYGRKLFVKALTDMPGSISGPTNGICSASTNTYSITPVSGATSYTWSVPSTATITSGRGNNSINVTFLSGFNTGNVCVTANNACGSSQSSCLFLSGTPVAPGQINGYSSVCKNQRNLMYNISPVPGATSYTWTVPQSANIIAGQGTANLVVNMGPNSGIITVRANSSCGSSVAQVKDIVITNCVVSQTYTTLFNTPQIRPIPEVVSNYGGFTKTNKLDLEWTLGETIVQTELSPVMMYTQGFHQPLNYIKIPSREGANLMITDLINIKVYPNPISSVLKLEFGTTEKMGTQNLQLEVQDVYGRTVKNKVVQTDNKVQEINMTNVMSGNYFLVIRNENGTLLRTIKLVKTN